MLATRRHQSTPAKSRHARSERARRLRLLHGRETSVGDAREDDAASIDDGYDDYDYDDDDDGTYDADDGDPYHT